jgi:hypothetical protein
MNSSTPTPAPSFLDQVRRDLQRQIAEAEAADAKQAAAKRAATNRQNARQSTGPRTAEGKAASSKNRLAHGLCSSSLILPGESQATFDDLRQQTHATFAPVTAEETLLTDQLTEALWRLNRAHRVESKAFEQAIESTHRLLDRFGADDADRSTESSLATTFGDENHRKTLAAIQRYVAAAERTYRAALKAVQDAIKRRKPEPQPVAVPVEKPKAAAAGQCLYPEAESLTAPVTRPTTPAYVPRW